MPCRPRRREPRRAQFGRCLPGQDGDPAADPGQGLLECLGLQCGPLVLRRCLATRTQFERSADGRSNPMVNAGAIAATSLVPGEDGAAKWRFISQGLSGFAGRDLVLSDEVYASAGRGRSDWYRGRASSRSAWSAPSRTITWMARSRPPSGCWPAAA